MAAHAARHLAARKKLDFGPVCGQLHALSMPSICKPMTSKSTNFRFIGQPIPRTEDARLLTGRGQFSDDFGFPGQTYAAMVSITACACAHRSRSIPPPPKRCRASSECLPVRIALPMVSDPIPHDPLPKTKYDMKLRGPGSSEIFLRAASASADRQSTACR